VNRRNSTARLIAALGLLLAGCGPSLPLSSPRWSPRGDRAAFVRYRAEGGDLYILEPGSDAPPRLVEAKVERFAFSVRGGKLYYLRPPVEDGKQLGALMSLDLDAAEDGGGAPKQLLLLERGASLANIQVGLAGKVYLEKQPPGEGARKLLEFDTQTMKLAELPLKEKNWTLFSGGSVAAPQVLLLKTKGKDVEVSLRSLTLKKKQDLGVIKNVTDELRPLALGPGGKSAVFGTAGKGGSALIVLRTVAGKSNSRVFPLPKSTGKVTLLWAQVSPDGARVLFSTLPELDKDDTPWTESWQADFKTGKLSRLARARGLLVGAPGYPSRGNRKLEFTPGGLALFEAGAALPVRVWPLNQQEICGAARMFLGAGKHGAALKTVSGALQQAGPATDRAALYVLKSEILVAAGKKEDAANAFLESLLRYPVSDLRRDDGKVARKLAAWSKSLPEHRILELVAKACKRRASGDLPAAARSMREAAGFSGDRAWAAGLQFGYAMNLLESGRGAAAGPIFRKVSEVKEFPQADWAAGLCVVAYALGNRNDLAGEELQRCNDRYGKSFLVPDFKGLARDLKLRPGKSRELERAATASGDSARLEVWPVTAMHLSFSPRPTAGGEARRRLALANHRLYRVVLAPKGGGQRALLDRVPFAMSKLSFSPNGKRIAFLAGDGQERSLYAISIKGKPVLGDIRALLGGRLDPATQAVDYSWDEQLNRPKPLKEKQ
jgi:WD40-like Beta Propeller Repeat